MNLFSEPAVELTGNPIIDGLASASEIAAALIGAVGVAIIAYGAAKGLLYFIYQTVQRDDVLIEIRIDLAKHLSLGLEFLVAKDIIDTIVRPSYGQLIVLLGIVMIRTLISHMLSREIREAARDIEGETKFEEALEKFETVHQRHKSHNHNQ